MKKRHPILLLYSLALLFFQTFSLYENLSSLWIFSIAAIMKIILEGNIFPINLKNDYKEIYIINYKVIDKKIRNTSSFWNICFNRRWCLFGFQGCKTYIKNQIVNYCDRIKKFRAIMKNIKQNKMTTFQLQRLRYKTQNGKRKHQNCLNPECYSPVKLASNLHVIWKHEADWF